MKEATNDHLILDPQLDDFDAFGSGSPGSESGDGLTVTVVSTTREGTQAALRLASTLAKDLCLRICLLAVHEVPFHFRLDTPPVSLDFLERTQMEVVAESELSEGQVSIEVFLCRSRKECLRTILRPRSLVIVGGRRRPWRNRARKLERWLAGEGHHVIFAEVMGRTCVPRPRSLALVAGWAAKWWASLTSCFAGFGRRLPARKIGHRRLSNISANRSIL
jgi:hypothetical protein